MVEARPKTEEEKYGDDGSTKYQAFKNKFRSVTNVKGINQLDVLNEISNWMKGTPKVLAEGFQGAKNPKSAMKKLWRELDQFYNLSELTAEERIKPSLAKGKIGKEDVDAHLMLMAELKAIQRAAKADKMADQLDRGDIVREVINGKVPFISDDFYRREARMKRKRPAFRMNFDDVIDAISERAAILKAQGKTSKSQAVSTAKVAAAKTTGQQNYSGVVKNSPPKQQQELPTKPVCKLCNFQHKTEDCNRWSQMTIEKRQEELRKRGLCFKCLTGGHISRWCPNDQPECKVCKKNHQSILHQDNFVLQKQGNEVAKEGEKEKTNQTKKPSQETVSERPDQA